MAQTRGRGAGDEAGAAHVPGVGAGVVQVFRPLGSAGGGIVDGTVGLGGHAELVLEALAGASVLGIDQDPEAIELAAARLSRFGPRARLVRGRVSELARIVRAQAIGPVQGLLLDLGVSSLQLDRAARGFSFQADGPLDMRMDPSRDRTPADIVNTWDEIDLADLF